MNSQKSWPLGQRNFALPQTYVPCIFFCWIFAEHAASYSTHLLFPMFPLFPSFRGIPLRYYFWSFVIYNLFQLSKSLQSPLFFLFNNGVLDINNFSNFQVPNFLLFWFVAALCQKSISLANDLLAWSLPNMTLFLWYPHMKRGSPVVFVTLYLGMWSIETSSRTGSWPVTLEASISRNERKTEIC